MASQISKKEQRFFFGQQFARVTVIILCWAGFIYQTEQFLTFYWTYPTVVDIQQSSPTYLDVPAFTICNPIGYNFSALCDVSAGGAVCGSSGEMRLATETVCDSYPDACLNGALPQDYQLLAFAKFLAFMEKLTIEKADMIRVKLEDYMSCTIEFAGLKRDCNIENVMGSFFTKDSLPQFCYTIYSVWGNINKQRDRISKGASMKFKFKLNASRRDENVENAWLPKSNIPTSPYVQIAVHSPYFLPSPYLEGSSYHGGMSYEMRVTMSEKNLLPAPYQTNCTNYMKTWKENDGRGPINQLNVIQGCRMKRWHSAVGCVPVTVDYPHSFAICGTNISEDPNITQIVSEDLCTLLADDYNQPCHYISYSTTKEEKDITISRPIKVRFLKQQETLAANYVPALRYTVPGYDCSGGKVWNRECSEIDIEVLFDRFEITNLTYNAKYESLELFSVLGGYMGIWLGISLVTVYDFFGYLLSFSKKWLLEKHRRRIRHKKVKDASVINGWMQANQEMRNI